MIFEKKIKALILLSGGLDSMLAAKTLQIQGIEVTGVCFISSFYGCAKAEKTADYLNIKLKVIDIRKEMLEVAKNPASGYGRNMNPCIDCHALMVKKASVIMKKEGYDFIATGEVLGERPFSQNKDALKQVEKLAGVEILRPLSAKLLGETNTEKQGLVNRGRLLNISGRSRHRQMELVEKYKIEDYTTPAGGCLLTDPEFSQRLIKMFDYWPDCRPRDVELLKFGRVFWITPKDVKEPQKILIVVGRNKNDNKNLEKLAQKDDIMLELKEIMGPTTLIRKIVSTTIKSKELKIEVPEKLKMSELKLSKPKDNLEIVNIAASLTGNFSTKARGKKVVVKITLLPSASPATNRAHAN